jgi:DNA-binding NtrC family response regulator
VAVNSAALPETLVESELFGHERGAFTGADRLRRGAFEAAGKGTLFLDEIGELAGPVQAKLLRVLEDGTITRVGGERAVGVAARVVCATHRDLEADAQGDRFRRDLLYRLNVHVIRVPPLREHLEDVPALVEFFLTVIADKLRVRRPAMAPRAVDALGAYAWERNNVRELRNVIERAMLAAGPREVDLEDLPAEIVEEAASSPGEGPPGSLRARKQEAERRIIVDALERNDWHITRTAQDLELSDHAALLKIMRRLGVTRT